jgi:hypothetical protein
MLPLDTTKMGLVPNQIQTIDQTIATPATTITTSLIAIGSLDFLSSNEKIDRLAR